jgi:hypothetical protein
MTGQLSRTQENLILDYSDLAFTERSLYDEKTSVEAGFSRRNRRGGKVMMQEAQFRQPTIMIPNCNELLFDIFDLER